MFVELFNLKVINSDSYEWFTHSTFVESCNAKVPIIVYYMSPLKSVYFGSKTIMKVVIIALFKLPTVAFGVRFE